MEAEAAQRADAPRYYAVNLLTSPEKINTAQLPLSDVLKNNTSYIVSSARQKRTVYRLRVGFFNTKKEAESVKTALVKDFPDSWVTQVTSEEKERAEQTALFRKESSGAVIQAEAIEDGQERPARKLMDEAWKAMVNGDYRTARDLYNKVARSNDPEFSKDAMEFAAVAMEKNNQFALALDAYKAYLEKYPSGEGAERVRQRIAGLETARLKPKESLRKAKEADATEVYGSFSQFYYRDENFTDVAGNTVTRSSLSNDLDLYVKKRGAVRDTNAVLVTGYELDFLDTKNSKTRISRLFLEVLSRQKHYSARVGRQLQSTGGVLGLFDGASFGYRLHPAVKANLVAGFPASSVFEKLETNKHFYGLNFDLGTFAGHWDFNVFIINQVADGYLDRRAIGGESRYFSPEGSFFTLVDYDINYDVLNNALFTGNWIFPDTTSVNVTFDYRRSPVLTTSNALQGQTVETLPDLFQKYGGYKSAVEYDALSRTPVSKSLTVSASRPINQKFQVNGDLSLSTLSATRPSGGVEGTAGTGLEYFLTLQLIGNNLIKEGDISIVGVRYSDTNSSKTISFNANSRYPVNTAWRINPRLRFDFSSYNQKDGEQVKIRPSIRTDYNWSKTLHLELEGGAEWTYEWLASETNSMLDYFLIAGYRMEF